MRSLGRFCLTAALAGAAFSAACFAAGSPVFFAEGPKDRKAVALTFDDGPGPYTEKVLDVLKDYGVKATFFMEGDLAAMRTQKVKAVVDAGHEVGSHTYSHINYYTYKKPDVESVLAEELEKTDRVLEKITGVRPYLVRMPNGYVRPWVKEVARKQNHVLINWTFGCDWKKMKGPDLAAAYIKNIRPGAIFLMHDGGVNRKSTVEALPLLIAELKNRGYDIVPVGKLLGLETPPAAPAVAKDEVTR